MTTRDDGAGEGDDGKLLCALNTTPQRLPSLLLGIIVSVCCVYSVQPSCILQLDLPLYTIDCAAACVSVVTVLRAASHYILQH